MKINQKREGDTVCVSFLFTFLSFICCNLFLYQQQYYLSSRRNFKTIVELVSFYERNDLGENFAG